jgi:hypothetical protein
MFINASLVASALAVQGEGNWHDRTALMTPAQTGEMLLAKTSPVLAVMMVVMAASLIIGILVFGVPVRGSLWMFVIAGVLRSPRGDRHWRHDSNLLEIAAAGAVVNILDLPPNYFALGSDLTAGEHARFSSEAFLHRPVALLGEDNPGGDPEGCSVECIVAQSSRLVHFCNHSVLCECVALPETVILVVGEANGKRQR